MSSLASLNTSLVGTVITADSVTIRKPAYKSPWLTEKVNGVISIQTSDGYWISLPDPTSLSITIYDIDSGDGTGRNQNGEMMRDRVGVKQKLTCKFPPMQRQDFQLMVALTKDTAFNVRFYSDYNRGYVTKKMYVGDREPGIYKGLFDPEHPEQQLYTEFGMNFIEF